MHHVIPRTRMKCSKCNSESIVAPCNEPDIDFRCLNCGHERIREQIKVGDGSIWTSSTVEEYVIEI